MSWNSRSDTSSEIIGLTEAREAERLSARPRPEGSPGWPRSGSIGRWIGFALLAVVLGGWLITALTSTP
ncbi:MAG: hypothetical protein K5924_11935 [Chloroflexi bacterium]|nr:hypothetical protein [Chloroflexota bacterium]